MYLDGYTAQCHRHADEAKHKHVQKQDKVILGDSCEVLGIPFLQYQ